MIQLLHKKKVGVEQNKVLQQHSFILPYNGKSHLCTFESDLYIPEDVFRIGRNIETSQCTFVIQGRDADGNDVLNCSGETIRVRKKVKQICFLGCALWGNQVATFTIVDSLGRSKEKRVFVSDWLDKAYPEEETVWSATFLPKKEGGDSCRAKVVQFSAYFDEAEYIEKLQFPSQEKVQLFALTVLAED